MNPAGNSTGLDLAGKSARHLVDGEASDQKAFMAGFFSGEDGDIPLGDSEQTGKEFTAPLVGCPFHRGGGQSNFQFFSPQPDNLVSAGSRLYTNVNSHPLADRGKGENGH
jgi:hypothetical protein